MNQIVLTACIAEVSALRYTPVGLPALDLRLEHESEIEEAGQQRQVKASVKTVAIGALAERLVQLPLGSLWQFTGFIASPRNSKNVVLHIQNFQSIS
ncbi:primosomal replication protein N [Limnohabitans sp.]|uniref:primosomal replication protein N n=1 Tax=Limnohabitans sp. TaxID=1907725 RepID=UPI0038BBA4BF